MIGAICMFAFSFISIALLFSVKYREAKTGSILVPTFRDWADEKAVTLKMLLMRVRVEIERLPPVLLVMIRHFVHVIALKFASLLRQGENQAYRLADIVSHKHRFQPRETRSEFLKQVSDHKNGGGASDVGDLRTTRDEIAS